MLLSFCRYIKNKILPAPPKNDLRTLHEANRSFWRCSVLVTATKTRRHLQLDSGRVQRRLRTEGVKQGATQARHCTNAIPISPIKRKLKGTK